MQFALVALDALAGDDNGGLDTLCVGVGEVILFGQVKQCERWLDVAVRLQFGLYTHLGHVLVCFIVRGLRVEPGHRNHETADVVVGDGKRSHLLIHKWTRGEDSLQAGESLALSRRSHIIGVVTGGKQCQHTQQNRIYLFHLFKDLMIISTRGIESPLYCFLTLLQAGGSGTSSRGSCGRGRQLIHSCK